MRNIFKLSFILCIITVVSSGLLAGAYNVTLPIIKAGRDAAKEEAMAKLLPNVIDNEFSDITIVADGSIVDYAAGLAKGDMVGYVISVISSGYGGPIEMMVGIDIDGSITGVEVLNHSETAGLGAKLTEPIFIDQFAGETGPLTVVKTTPAGDNQITSITASTITSNAVILGVNNAVNFYEANLKGAN